MFVNGIDTRNCNQEYLKNNKIAEKNVSNVATPIFGNNVQNVNNQSALTNDTYECRLTNEELTSIKQDLEKTKEEQGWIGKGWDWFKNATGLGAGSDKASEAIEQYEKGVISKEEMMEAVNGYKDGQKMSVDVVADMVSGIVAVGAIAAAPFTGGASLLLAAGVGAGLKVAIKGTDALIGGREYNLKDFGYDMLTGGVNGLMSPITNGLGGAAGTGVAKVFGLNAVKSVAKEGAEEALKQAGKGALKQAGKGFISKILAKQGTEYVLKEGAKATFKTTTAKVLAYGADMMVDGALSGATDNAVRAFAEGRYEDIGKDTFEGLIGGAVTSPIIGGGFRAASKAGSKVLNVLNNKLTLRNLLPDGTSTIFRQGKTGDCHFLSMFNNMLNDSKTAKLIKKSITTNADGNYSVRIGNQTVTVLKDSLTDEMLSDNTGVRIFEQAYKQVTGSLDGGFADIVAKQFGLNPIHIVGDEITDEMLEKISKNQKGLALSFGVKVDVDGVISPDGNFNHYFSIKNVDMDSKIVQLVDPNDTSKVFDVSFNDIKQQGISIDGGSVKKLDLPNSVRNVDDVAFEVSKKSKKAVLSKIDTNKSVLEKAGIASELGEIENGAYSIDFIAAQLALNKINPEEFVDLVSKNNMARSLKTLLLYKEITTNKLFSPFNLSLENVDEIANLLIKGDVFEPDEFAKIIKSSIDTSSFSSKQLYDEYVQRLTDDKLLELAWAIQTKSVNSTFDASSVINLGDINGSQKMVLAKGVPHASSVNLDSILNQPATLPTLIKSNIITTDIAEFLYGLDESKLLKLGILKEVVVDGQVQLVSIKKASKFVVGDVDADKFKINLSTLDVIEKLHNHGIDSLTSNEIHLLTDTFADLYEKNSNFKNMLAKIITKQDVSSKIKTLYEYIGSLKQLSSKMLGPDIDIEEHALMRMFDRNLLNVQKSCGDVSEYIDFPTFMTELKTYLTSNPYSFKVGQNDIVIDYLNGLNGLSVIFTKDINGKIVINSVM